MERIRISSAAIVTIAAAVLVATVFVGVGYAVIASPTARPDGTGEPTQTAGPVQLTPAADFDNFSYALAVSGTHAIVCSTQRAGGIGAARAYEWTPTNGWQFQADLATPPVAPQRANFGSAVAIEGTTAMVGALGATLPGGKARGLVSVFTWDGSSWSRVDTLTVAATFAGTDDSRFGFSIALQGDTAVIGAPQASVGGKDFTGSIYVFRRVAGIWTESPRIDPPSPATTYGFGEALSLDGSTLAIGDYEYGGNLGAVWAARRSGTGWSTATTVAVAPVTPIPGALGIVVAASGDTIWAGQPGAQVAGVDQAGVVKEYQWSGSSWTASGECSSPTGPHDSENFGFGLAASGDTLLVGARLGMVPGMLTGAGVVHKMRHIADGLVPDGMLTPSPSSAWYYFGSPIGFDGRNAVVGAQRYPVTSQGAAWFYGGFSRYETTAGVPLTVPAPGLLGNDILRGALTTAVAATGPAHGAVSVSPDGSFTYTPSASYEGTDSFTYAAGSAAGTTTAPVYVHVNKAPALPTSVTIKTTATSARIGNIPILSGAVTPFGMVGKNMVAYVMKPGKTYWTYSSNRTVYNLGGKAAWQYKYYFKPGMVKGVYKFKAVVPAWPGFLTSTSSTTVSIRLR